MHLKNMKNDFCFIIISYNQEKYVIQHFESIKYQITHFGYNKKIQLIFSDDASEDRTVELAEKWIERHKEIFNEIVMLKRTYNVGTVLNFCDSISHLNAKSYKLLSCDDLYFLNNIFELTDKADFIMTPTIHFFDSGEVEKSIVPEYYRFLQYKNKKNIRIKIRRMLKYNQCIPTPGVFLNPEFWKNQNLIDAIMRYKYIEDIAEWNFLFNDSNLKFSIVISEKPYVLYRRGCGISNMITHSGTNPIDTEYKMIRNEIPAKEDFLPKYINPFVYLKYIMDHIYNPILGKRRKIRDALFIWSKEVNKSQNYLNYIFDVSERERKEILNK